MNVLVLGSGGREHAFCWKIAQSTLLDKLYCAPGNPGTAQLATNVELSLKDFKGIKKFVLENNISTVVVGPEDPLVAGITNFFLDDVALKKVSVIGPTKEGAQLEGSKEFAKSFMMRYGIPTAKYKAFTADSIEEGYQFLSTLKSPYVLKADGLAAGKGVVILKELDEAKEELKEMLTNKKFGKASEKVVIEEFLKGHELSVFALSDGNSYKILPTAKDYKRVGEGDSGLNTGGMGAISPAPYADKEFIEKVEMQIIKPTIEGLKQDGIIYKGFIFVGLMKVGNEPYVIEYNVRMGDPETEVVLPRLQTDLLDLFDGISSGTLSEKHIDTEYKSAATVMMVSGGYPGKFDTGKEITGLELESDSIIFHASTKQDSKGIKTAGGRVLAVTSLGNTTDKAIEKSYNRIASITYDRMFFRKDIGFDLPVKETK